MPARSMLRSSLLWVLTVAGCAAVGALVVRPLLGRSAPPPLTVSELLGQRIPDSPLTDSAGAPVTLRALVQGRPALIVVLGTKDCLSCASYAMELAILHRRLPGLRQVVVASGPEHDLFARYFSANHIRGTGFFDPDRALLKALQVRAEPLTLVADAEGRILFVDARSSSAASHFPFGRLLPLLGQALDSTAAVSPGKASN